VEFFKYHSLGNDFILIDALKSPVRLSPEDIRMLCDRHLGIGSDGIILIEPSQKAACRMVNYNPDASEAGVSGNGLRCLAKHLYDTGGYTEKRMRVETPSGIRDITIHTAMGRVTTIEVNMGKPDFRRSSIPMKGEGEEAVDQPLEVGGRRLNVTCLSMGSPHCVLFLEEPDGHLVRELGPALENHPVFPLRVNVEFAQVINMSEMRLRSWERGAGETLASAAGAAAAVAAALRTGRCKRKVHVQLPGGLMEVEVTPKGEVLTRGPARRVFRGELDEDWKERSRIILA
jgi:diaminopimelate epimerase